MSDFNDFLNKKLESNSDIIIFTFYEVRVALNMYEDEAKEFLEMCQEELEDLGYKVYYTGSKYMYNNVKKTVERNQLMVAVKSK